MTAHPSPSTAELAPRWPLLELARWVAIYAIVWLHTVRSELFSHSTMLTRFAVPFFVAASVFLVFQGVRRRPERSFLAYSWQRFVRIYLPFLVWSGIYLGFKAFKGASMPDLANRYPSGFDILWAGGFFHLWFMPFILVLSVAAFAIAKMLHGHDRLKRLAAPVAFGVGVAISLPSVAGIPLTSDGPLNYMAQALPAAFWGMTLGLICDEQPSPRWRCRARFGVDAVTFAVCLTILGICGRMIPIENLAGVALLLMSLCPTQSPLLRRLANSPSLAFGIYLSHMLPIKICEAFANRGGLPVTWQLDLAIFVASAVGATLLTWFLYRFRWTRWLVA